MQIVAASCLFGLLFIPPITFESIFLVAKPAAPNAAKSHTFAAGSGSSQFLRGPRLAKPAGHLVISGSLARYVLFMIHTVVGA